MQRQNQKTIGASRTMMINPRASLAGVDAANGQCWYEIRALSAGRVEIFLYDVIGGWGITAQQFVADCKEAGVFDASAVDLHIHSPGGDVMQGFAIYNTLSRLKAKVDIWVDGVAASMASMIVCLPGATVHMPENAWIMVHKPWGGIAGDSDDMRDYAAWLDRNEALMLSAYMNKTGLGQEELESMLKAETWLNGAEAVEKGFADTLEPELQAAACVNENKLKDYQNMPEQIKSLFAPRAEAPVNQPQQPAPVQANLNPPAPQQPAQQMTNIDITALAQQLQQQMQTANAERVNTVSAVFEAFPTFATLKAECLADFSCTAEKARDRLLQALAAGTTPSAGPGAIHMYAGNGNLVGDSIRAAVMTRAGYAQAEKDNAYNGYTVGNTVYASKEITAGYSGAFAWVEQYKTKAPFFNSYSTTGASEYHPVIKQQATIASKNSWAFSFGSLVAGTELSWHLHMKGSGGSEVNFKWDTNGNFNAPGQVNPGSYANFDNRYYTKSQSDAGYMPRTGAYTKAESDGRFQPKGSYTPAGQAYTKAESDSRYNLKNTATKSANAMTHKDASTGVMEVVMSNINVPNKTNVNVTFPAAFPNACVGVVITYNGAGHGAGDDSAIYVPSYSRTGCTLYAHNAQGRFMLIAKGY